MYGLIVSGRALCVRSHKLEGDFADSNAGTPHPLPLGEESLTFPNQLDRPLGSLLYLRSCIVRAVTSTFDNGPSNLKACVCCATEEIRLREGRVLSFSTPHLVSFLVITHQLFWTRSTCFDDISQQHCCCWVLVMPSSRRRLRALRFFVLVLTTM